MTKVIFSRRNNLAFTSTGMEVSNSEITFEQWQAAGQSLKEAEEGNRTSFAFCWGDWLAYGEPRYGQTYDEAMAITGLTYQTLANYRWVAASTPREIRGLPGLSFRHYLATVKVENIEQRREWLEQASTEGWSAYTLAEKLKGELPPPPVLSSGESPTFISWLGEKIKASDFNQSEFAQRGKVSEATVSLVLSGQRHVGEDMVLAIHNGLHVPLEEVFTRLGWLNGSSNGTGKQELIDIYEQLGDNDREQLLNYARSLAMTGE